MAAPESAPEKVEKPCGKPGLHGLREPAQSSAEADMQLRSVDQITEKGDVGFEIRVGTKRGGGCLKGEKMERRQRERGNCQGGPEGVQSFLSRFFPP